MLSDNMSEKTEFSVTGIDNVESCAKDRIACILNTGFDKLVLNLSVDSSKELARKLINATKINMTEYGEDIFPAPTAAWNNSSPPKLIDSNVLKTKKGLNIAAKKVSSEEAVQKAENKAAAESNEITTTKNVTNVPSCSKSEQMNAAGNYYKKVTKENLEEVDHLGTSRPLFIKQEPVDEDVQETEKKAPITAVYKCPPSLQLSTRGGRSSSKRVNEVKSQHQNQKIVLRVNKSTMQSSLAESPRGTHNLLNNSIRVSESKRPRLSDYHYEEEEPSSSSFRKREGSSRSSKQQCPYSRCMIEGTASEVALSKLQEPIDEFTVPSDTDLAVLNKLCSFLPRITDSRDSSLAVLPFSIHFPIETNMQKIVYEDVVQYYRRFLSKDLQNVNLDADEWPELQEKPPRAKFNLTIHNEVHPFVILNSGVGVRLTQDNDNCSEMPDRRNPYLLRLGDIVWAPWIRKGKKEYWSGYITDFILREDNTEQQNCDAVIIAWQPATIQFNLYTCVPYRDVRPFDTAFAFRYDSLHKSEQWYKNVAQGIVASGTVGFWEHYINAKTLSYIESLMHGPKLIRELPPDTINDIKNKSRNTLKMQPKERRDLATCLDRAYDLHYQRHFGRISCLNCDFKGATPALRQ